MTYTVTVTNTSTAPASNVVVADVLPTGINATTLKWTCSATGVTCPNASGGVSTTGGVTYLFNASIPTLPPGGVLTYTITAQASTGGAQIVNTATVTAPNLLCDNGSAPPCSATVSNPAVPVIQLTKTANLTSGVQPGSMVVYTITAKNTNATANATGVIMVDALPPGIAAGEAWKCQASAGATCTASGSANATNLLNDTGVTLPAKGGQVVYTVTAQAASTGLPASIGNTVIVSDAAGGTDWLCASGKTGPCQATAQSAPANADMSAASTPPASVVIGTPVSVATSRTNNGPNAAQNATCVVTGAPAGATTTCVPTPPVTLLAVNASIVCTTTFTPADVTPITLVTTAGSDTPDPNASNNVDSLTVTPIQPAPPVPVPLLDKLALAMLAMLLAASGAAVRMRRNSVRR